MSLADRWEKIKAHQDELWIILAAMLGLALVLGLWQWYTVSRPVAPLTVENVPNNLASVTASKSSDPSPMGEGSKRYVASKSGTKYYLPSCAGANRIKEENKVWFATAEEARAKGLTPAANCQGL